LHCCAFRLISNHAMISDSNAFDPIPPFAGQRFDTLIRLRRAHDALLARVRSTGDTAVGPGDIADAHTLITGGTAVGAALDLETDRRAAQSLIDYWYTFLIGQKQPAPDPTLVPFDAEALRAPANAAWAAMSSDELAAAQLMLARLASLDDNYRLKLTDVPQSALLAAAGTSDSARQALARLVEAGVLALSHSSDAPLVRITHDAYARNWAPLITIIEETRTLSRLRQTFHDDAARWNGQGRPERLLWKGVRYEQALFFTDLSREELLFRDACTVLEQRDLIAERRTSRRLRVLTVLAVLGTVLAIGFGMLALNQSRLAQSRQYALRAADLRRDREPEAAALLSAYAYAQTPSAEARDALISTRQLATDEFVNFSGRHDAGAQAWGLQWVSDTLVLSSAEDGALWAWNPISKTGTGMRYDIGNSGIYALALSPDKRRLVSGDGRGNVRLWAIESGGIRALSVITEAQRVRRTIYALAFHPDGRSLVVGASDIDNKADSRIDIYSLGADGATPISSTTVLSQVRWIWSLAFSPDGTRLAAGTRGEPGAAWVWDVTQITSPTLMHTQTAPVGMTAVAFHPNGDFLLTGDAQGGLYTGTRKDNYKLAQRSKRFSGIVRALVFDSTGSRVVSAGPGASLWLFDVTTPTSPVLTHRLTGQQASALRVVFSSDDHTLFATATDGGLTRWDLNRRALETSLPVARDNMYAQSDDGSVQLRAACVLTAAPFGQCVRSSLTLTQTGSGRVFLEHPESINAVALTPDRRMVRFAACIKRNSEAICLRSGVFEQLLADQMPRMLFEQVGRTDLIIHNANGSHIATGSSIGRVTVFDVRTGRTVSFLESHDVNNSQGMSTRADVRALAFGPDPSLLVSGSNDHTVMLWDTAAGRRIGSAFIGHTAAVVQVSLAGNANEIVSVDAMGQLRRWPLSNESARARACEIAGRELTEEEWRQYIPDRTYQRLCD
jgi:WD40 repeat protein